MAELSDTDLLVIQHPDQKTDAEARGLQPAEATTSRKAFADLWEPRGFVVIRDDTQAEIDAEAETAKPGKARPRTADREGSTTS